MFHIPGIYVIHFICLALVILCFDCKMIVDYSIRALLDKIVK